MNQGSKGLFQGSKPVTKPVLTRKTLGIAEFLEWAFNEELPKGGGREGIAGIRSAWGRIMRWAELMTEVYQGAGVMEYVERTGDPHPDAVKAGQAVAALSEFVMDLPSDWNPLEMAALTPAARAAVSDAIAMIRGDDDQRRLSLLPVGIVVRCAVLKRAPDYPQAIKVTERVVSKNGKPLWFVCRKVVNSFGQAREMEVDGFNLKTGKPMPGAYRKYEYPREIVADIAARAEWQLWRAALDILFEDLSPAVENFTLLPSTLPLEPWVDGLPKQKSALIRPDLRRFANGKTKSKQGLARKMHPFAGAPQ